MTARPARSILRVFGPASRAMSWLVADRQDAIAPDGHGLRDRKAFIDGDDFAVQEDQIGGLWRLRMQHHGREHRRDRCLYNQPLHTYLQFASASPSRQPRLPSSAPVCHIPFRRGATEARDSCILEMGCEVARSPIQGEKPLYWVGSSKRDLLEFPEPVKDAVGTALSVAQFGGKHPAAKPWKGEGAGVLEVVEDHAGDTYRAVYTVRFENVIYVLHAFQKKSPKGIKTAQRDVELVRKRLKVAQQDYEERYGKAKK